MLQEIHHRIEHLEKKTDEQDRRMTRHLEVYANNGKELRELRLIIERIVPLFEQNTKQTKEMYDVFMGLSATKKYTFRFGAWLIGGLMTLGGAYLMIKEIFIK